MYVFAAESLQRPWCTGARRIDDGRVVLDWKKGGSYEDTAAPKSVLYH